MKKLLIPLLLLAAVMVATFLFKNRGQDSSPTGRAAVPRRPHADQLYVEVAALGGLDYFYDHKLGMKLAGEILGVQTDYIGPAEYDMTAMITAFEQVLARPNLKGVVVVGFEDVLVPIINKAVAKGIPVVTVDADLAQSKRVAFVGTGNYQAGYLGGHTLAGLLGGQGKVALLTKAGQSNLEERIRGYKAALADFPGIEVVQVVDTQSDPTIAAQAAAAVLERHRDLAGLACVEAAGGLGAATAVRERGLAGKVRIVAMDRGNDILRLIGQGVIDATVAQQTVLMPFYATQILYNLQNHPLPIAHHNAQAGVAGAPTVVDTGAVIIDRHNWEEFLRNQPMIQRANGNRRAGNDPPLLEVRDVVKTFPGVRALDGVCFELRRGEVHALVGENGAGKSTLINLLAGVHQPDSGAILLDGQPVRFPNPHEAARHGIGVVFQERSLCPNLSVAENIFAARQPLRHRRLDVIDWAGLRQQTTELLRQCQLPLDPDLPVKHLSAALQQLVEILKAISLQPRILILDEPTSSLTASETDVLFETLRRLKQQGLSFVYVSHHLPEVFAIADRVTVFRDGRHVHTCATTDITETELIHRMVGRELTDLFGQRRGPIGPECFRLENGGRSRDFRAINFAVHRGEIVGVAGLAGAGRTELGRGIFGVEPLDTGQVYLDGEPVALDSPAAAIARQVGYLTEDRKELGLFLDLSVRANCVAANLRRFAGRAGRIDEDAVTAFARGCVQDFHIVTPSLDQKVVNLSGGNQQKVLLSLWLAVNPKFLIVDEPTRGVNVGARRDIYHRLRELAAAGVGLLMISSDLTEILGMSDRILVMREGRLVREFAAAEATEQLIIAAATGVDPANDRGTRADRSVNHES